MAISKIGFKSKQWKIGFVPILTCLLRQAIFMYSDIV